MIHRSGNPFMHSQHRRQPMRLNSCASQLPIPHLMDELCRREARRAMMDLLSQERDRRYRSHHWRRVLGASPKSRKSLRTSRARKPKSPELIFSQYLPSVSMPRYLAHGVPTFYYSLLVPAHQTFIRRTTLADVRPKLWTYKFLSLPSPSC